MEQHKTDHDMIIEHGIILTGISNTLTDISSKLNEWPKACDSKHSKIDEFCENKQSKYDDKLDKKIENKVFYWVVGIIVIALLSFGGIVNNHSVEIDRNTNNIKTIVDILKK